MLQYHYLTMLEIAVLYSWTNERQFTVPVKNVQGSPRSLSLWNDILVSEREFSLQSSLQKDTRNCKLDSVCWTLCISTEYLFSQERTVYTFRHALTNAKRMYYCTRDIQYIPEISAVTSSTHFTQQYDGTIYIDLYSLGLQNTETEQGSSGDSDLCSEGDKIRISA